MYVNTTTIYPGIGAEYDLLFVRLSGHGLGNCFYTYFHAVTIAERVGADVITPPWVSIKLGPLLRGERSKRTYWRMFKPFPGEIHGIQKLITLLRYFITRKLATLDANADTDINPGLLNVVRMKAFTFCGLHQYRPTVRNRLLGIIKDPVPSDHTWGSSDFVAVHIRLGGDFSRNVDASAISSGQANVVIPLAWYAAVIRSLRSSFPQKKVYVFSDGNADELAPILDLGAELHNSGSDVLDLLKMSSASILVGSNSTYSRWAAFLGDMPSIWIEKDIAEEKPSGAGTPIAYVPLNTDGRIIWI